MSGPLRRTARAVYFTGEHQVEVRDEEIPEKGDGVFVESRLIGISHGTEMNIYRGTFTAESLSDEPLSDIGNGSSYPLKYGYMNAGTTEDGKTVFAFYPHQDRFFCRTDSFVELPADVPFEDAVFFATMETALGIVQDTHPHFAETGLVAGLGVVGLLVCELFLRSGVSRLFAMEPSPFRRSKAEAFGCIPIDPSGADVPERLFRETEGRGVDFTVNTSSSAEALQICLDSLVREGTAVEASWYGSRRTQLVLGERFHRRRLSIRSSQVSRIGPGLSGAWDRERRRKTAASLLSAVKPSRYITHRFPLEHADRAFAFIDSSPPDLIQAVLEPGS